MAQYSVTRACGHEEIVNLIGKHKLREWRLQNVEPNKLCSSCYHAELARQREKATSEAVEAAKAMELPVLAGTEKQIAWAETIRQEVMLRAEGFLHDNITDEERGNLMSGLDELQKIESARWWIDHRDINLRELGKLLIKTAKEQQTLPPKSVVDAAKIEATVRPENTVTETVAEIRALESSIEIWFPEKREDFREIVRYNLDMDWTGLCWKRKIAKHNGTSQDRAAESGHRLLAAGFPVRIFDDETRQKAIEGSYEPEHTRWIMCRTTGGYAGYLVVRWGKGEDYYRAAKGVNGSRYDKPDVVVPPEHFAEVLDFAQIYDFRISTGAQKAIGSARLAWESILTVIVTPPAEKKLVITDGKPPVLEIPNEVGIADEFRD